MTYEIIRYNEVENYHRCKDEFGNFHNLDLTTDATFPELSITNNLGDIPYIEFMRSLVGKKFECEETFPYVSFARNGRFIE